MLTRQKLSEEKRIRDKLERDQEESGKLRQRLMEREHELQAMTSLRQQALAEAERSKEVMHDLRKDAENARSQAQRAQGEAERYEMLINENRWKLIHSFLLQISGVR